MRKLKKGFTLTMILAMSVMLAGCGSGKKKDKKTTEKTTTEATAEIKEATTESQTTTDEDETKAVGVVTEIRSESLRMKLDDGKQYWFSIKDAKKSYKNGIEVGNLISVRYEGKLTKSGSDYCKAKEVINREANEGLNKSVKYAKVALNVRKEANASSKLLGYYNRGDKVECTGKTVNGWAQVNYKGEKGYCVETELSKSEVIKATTTTEQSDTTEKTEQEEATTTENQEVTVVD